MKKLVRLTMAVSMVVALAASASALTTWTDVYVPENSPLYFTDGTTHQWTHNLVDDGFDPLFGGGWWTYTPAVYYQVTLDVSDDLFEGRDWFWDLLDFKKEFAELDQPGFNGDIEFEIDFQDVEAGMSLFGLGQINLFGTLTLELTGTGGDFYFTKSTLLAADQPIPEPGTMILLGSGLVGLAGYGRKRRKDT